MENTKYFKGMIAKFRTPGNHASQGGRKLKFCNVG